MTEDEQAIWDAMRDVYAGFLAGDPDRMDSHLHPDVTIWDMAEAPLTVGLPALHELRTRRPATPVNAPVLSGLESSDPVVTVWGDTGLLRHLVRARYADGAPDELVRNTSVWRRTGGVWLAVHNHEDLLPPAPRNS